jgi:hypothetical protein
MRNDQLAAVLSQIETVVQGLGTLTESAVFLGGAVTSLFITDSNVLRVRPTKDVDIIVNVSRTGYYKLEDELRSRGFVQKLTGDEPICRWHYADVAVDVMPTDESILNFGNRWYPEAFSCSEQLELPSGGRIRLIPAILFICSKINAVHFTCDETPGAPPAWRLFAGGISCRSRLAAGAPGSRQNAAF